MTKIFGSLFFICLFNNQSASQILPQEGAKLNYRIIGFSVSLPKNALNKRIEIAKGNFNNEDSFKKNIVKNIAIQNNKKIIEVPSFGTEYTWRYISTTQKSANEKSEFHHFSTLMVSYVDTNINRLKIIQPAQKYKDAYVFIEATQTLYDMRGHPVWYLPDLEGVKNEDHKLRDLKISPQKTITFLYEDQGAYEINYDAKILWKAPNTGQVSGDNSEHYHHEFTRLSNGNYVVLGSETALWDKAKNQTDASGHLFYRGDKKDDDSLTTAYTIVPSGNIIEYDKNGNLVWSWRSSEYFKHSDIVYHMGRHNMLELSPHENSFCFDEKNKKIYLSFRNISRIIKLKYPEAQVERVYGESFKPEIPETYNGLFCWQHSVMMSQSGNLYLYNNNMCDPVGFPKIIMMEESKSNDVGLKKNWEYQCTIEGATGNTQDLYQFPYGGNVTELPDYSIFTSMSSFYSKVFIVAKDKKEIWSAIPQTFNKITKKWDYVIQFKASLINSRKELEQLIWNSEK